MKKVLLIFAIIGVISTSLSSCAGKKSRHTNSATMEAMNDTTKIGIDIDMIDTVKLLFTEEESEVVMDKSDYVDFADFLSTAIYDSKWNDSGIMVKMVAPDYTAIISYENKPADDNGWLMVWKESGRAKFHQKWFFIAEDKREGLYSLLDKYKKDIVMTVFPERNDGAPQTLELTVNNNTSEVIQFGASYSIEHLKDGKWGKVDLGDFAVVAIMYGVQPGDSGKYTINLFTDTVTYPEGDYRIVKNINTGEKNVRPYYANFKII